MPLPLGDATITSVTDTEELRSDRDADEVDPHVVVLFGAMGDLAKRKLLPGLFLSLIHI